MFTVPQKGRESERARVHNQEEKQNPSCISAKRKITSGFRVWGSSRFCSCGIAIAPSYSIIIIIIIFFFFSTRSWCCFFLRSSNEEGLASHRTVMDLEGIFEHLCLRNCAFFVVVFCCWWSSSSGIHWSPLITCS